MREVTLAESHYVDQMVGQIISGMIRKDQGNTTLNPDFFEHLTSSAYELALRMLEVKRRKVKVKEVRPPLPPVNNVNITAPVEVPVPTADVADVAVAMAEVGSDLDAVAAASKKRGRPKGSRNKSVRRKRAVKKKEAAPSQPSES